jgi:hypothetical protein
VQTDNALVVLADTHRDNGAGLPRADRDLVAGQQRHTAAGRHRAVEHVSVFRVHAALVALAPERGDRLGVGEHEPRRAAPREQLVEVVGGRRPGVVGEGGNVTERCWDGSGWYTGAFTSGEGDEVSATSWYTSSTVHIRVYVDNEGAITERCWDGDGWYTGAFTASLVS